MVQVKSVISKLIFTLILLQVFNLINAYAGPGQAVQDEHDQYIQSGSAFRIVNTLCGRIVLRRPTHGLSFENWKEYYSYNQKLCECRKYGPTTTKYSYFFILRLLMSRDYVSVGPIETDEMIRANKTLHLLMDHNKTIHYYEYYTVKGDYKFSFTSNLTKVSELNRTILYSEHYFSYLLKNIVSDQISVTLLNSSSSYWEAKINGFGNGVVAFVIDPDLPKVPKKGYFDAKRVHEYFKDFHGE